MSTYRDAAHLDAPVERVWELVGNPVREIQMRCMTSGMYARWLLTSAQGGTFVELQMGMDPLNLSNRVFDFTAGRLYFRRWSSQSLQALRTACTSEARPQT